MTLLEYFELCDYWADYPPVHEILKLVHKVERKEKPRYMDASAAVNLMKATGGKMEGLLRL